MTATEEQQMLVSLTAISQDMKALLSLVKELTLQQEAANEKAYSQLVHIAHKR
jgi:alpha-galactosidase